MTVLIDSSVLLDIFTRDPVWFDWSSQQIARCAETDVLAVNPLIYAEVSVHFSRVEELEEALPAEDFRRLPLPWSAGFLAGRCFVTYRQCGGARRSPLPDFYIGAHAAVDDLTLLTRDGARYRTYFPKVRLIAPRE